MIFPPTASAADYFTSHLNCVATSSASSCWYRFSDAVKAATNNVISDAPDTMPSYFSPDWDALQHRMEAANPNLTGMLASDVDYSGNGVLIIAMGGCQRNPLPSPSGNINLNTEVWGFFDNRVNSGVSFNSCQMSFSQHSDGNGTSLPAQTNIPSAGSLAEDVTSVKFYHNPTTAEASAFCQVSLTCIYQSVPRKMLSARQTKMSWKIRNNTNLPLYINHVDNGSVETVTGVKSCAWIDLPSDHLKPDQTWTVTRWSAGNCGSNLGLQPASATKYHLNIGIRFYENVFGGVDAAYLPGTKGLISKITIGDGDGIQKVVVSCRPLGRDRCLNIRDH
ncbi:hypothetical protein GCM10022295_89360 [Streptomyces osmaniensis]|uniref:Uncharacterized protein n=2 Tax=Streptomyces osmaniensis TaxID=593134 RepID=A0ABP6Z0G9_9ACTN